MKNLFLLILPLFLLSCNNSKEIKSEKGAIDILSNVYFNASKGLEESKHFHISKINYIGDDIIELIPNIDVPDFTENIIYIKDSLYYTSDSEEMDNIVFTDSDLLKNAKNLYNKDQGAVWINIPIFNYETRQNLTDTLLYNKKNYKRFQIHTEDNYAVFYVHPTDTILPYSLNRIAEKDYKGRIERIDSYDKSKDLFTTMWLIPRQKLDDEAKEIFEFNQFVQKKEEEKNDKN